MIKMDKGLNIIFIGAPGSGKGTLASMVKDKLNVMHLSTGDVFRKAIANKTELGLKVQSILAAGKYVDDEITNQALANELESQQQEFNGFILDGYPRTIKQAEFLDKKYKIDHVIHIEVKEELLIKRLSGRITCQNCKEVYNIYFKKPKVEMICDKCSSKLIKREDDNESVAKERIEVYNKLTSPLIEYYDKRKLIRVVHSNDTFEKTALSFLRIIGK
jgi:adenylate kinase